MLGVVEHEHVAGGRLGGDDAGVLGHEAGPVDLQWRVCPVIQMAQQHYRVILVVSDWVMLTQIRLRITSK